MTHSMLVPLARSSSSPSLGPQPSLAVCPDTAAGCGILINGEGPLLVWGQSSGGVSEKTPIPEVGLTTTTTLLEEKSEGTERHKRAEGIRPSSEEEEAQKETSYSVKYYVSSSESVRSGLHRAQKDAEDEEEPPFQNPAPLPPRQLVFSQEEPPLKGATLLVEKEGAQRRRNLRVDVGPPASPSQVVWPNSPDSPTRSLAAGLGLRKGISLSELVAYQAESLMKELGRPASVPASSAYVPSTQAEFGVSADPVFGSGATEWEH